MADVEVQQRPHSHAELSIEIDPAGQGHHQVAAGRPGLDRRLHEYVQGPLEPNHVTSVLESLGAVA